MSNSLKTYLIICGVLLAIVAVPLLIISIITSSIFESSRGQFESAHSDSDIIKYVEDTHNMEVRIIENEGRDPSSLGGLSMEDALVETVDHEAVEFTVHINTFGKITGDDYKDIVARDELNQALYHSTNYDQLKKLGFTEMQFGEEQSDDDFSMSLPEELNIYDEEALRKVYESLPVLKKLQNEAKKKNVAFDMAYVDTVQIDLQKDYESWLDLANKLVKDNMDKFANPFMEEAEDKMKDINDELNALGFNTEREPTIECLNMDGYDDCTAYSLILYTEDGAEDEPGGQCFYIR